MIQPQVNPAIQTIIQELEIAVADGFTLQMEYRSGNEASAKRRLIDL